MAQDKIFSAPASARIYEIPPEHPGATETQYDLRITDFLPSSPEGTNGRRRRKGEPEPFLIIGFDTEYKVPENPIDRDDIRSGKAKYSVLSYQFHCLNDDGDACSGICCPEDGERLSLGRFLTFALGKSFAEGKIGQLPRSIYLVGHFTRADMPAFDDFESYTKIISAVRNTFISIDTHIKVKINFRSEGEIFLKVFLRDTMLLTPGSSKSLSALGEILNRPKIKLHEDRQTEQYMKTNMDLVRRDHWELFRQYALNDAIICAEYLQKISDQNQQATGKKKVPVTLTSIGVELLWSSWKNKLNLDPLDILGQELYEKETWDRKLNRFRRETEKVPLAQCHWHEAFVTETYHGGRNEQFWFGPCYEANWTDYDLSSAYPTAMALIGKADWANIRNTNDISEFTPTTLGYAYVEFKFPSSVRYPTFPIRTNNGLIFPLEGRSYCAAPEIYLAQQLGAEIRILHGIIVPTNPQIRIFGDFIKDCIARRNSYEKKSLNALFWKEISNSTYGKTAQGLRKKRVYDMRERRMDELPKSRITNPFFASFITSFVRAVLGEIINGLPKEILVFSCTTDGFITDATDQQMAITERGHLAKIFSKSREYLTGKPSVLEKKHEIKLPLGWRTRGQATLIPGEVNESDSTYNVILARGGITLPDDLDDVQGRSKHVCDLFFARTPDDILTSSVLTGVRDIIEHDADLVPLEITRRLSMEFDWKRRPLGIGEHPDYGNHLIFSTSPWVNDEHFKKARAQWIEFQKKTPTCLKSIAELDNFSRYLQMVTALSLDDRKYLASYDPDLKRLKRILCSAWHHKKAGLTGPIPIRSKNKSKNVVATASDFANVLTQCGILTRQSDVQNAKKKAFEPHKCVATQKSVEAAERLKKIFPDLQLDLIFISGTDMILLSPAKTEECSFIKRIINPR